MDQKWSEMSKQKKIETVVVLALTAVALVFAVLDLSGNWENNLCYLMLAILSVYEAVVAWKVNRKMAIAELVVAVCLLFNAFN